MTVRFAGAWSVTARIGSCEAAAIVAAVATKSLRFILENLLVERPTHQNQERAGLVAIRARHRAELQVGESVDVAALDRQRARGAKAGAATDHRRIAGGGTIGRGTRAATRPASQFEGDLRAGIRVGRD